jgi:YggT family protein
VSQPIIWPLRDNAAQKWNPCGKIISIKNDYLVLGHFALGAGLQPMGSLLASLLNLYSFVLMARLLLSWVPSVDWHKTPWSFLYAATEPVLAPFRKLIPPIAGLDISPIVVFFLLGLLRNIFGML